MRRIYITSDWHLGGTCDVPATGNSPARVGTQICRSSPQLTAFIDWVRAQAEGGDQVELVINGDMVDFLAPEDGVEAVLWLGDEVKAVEKLDRIVAQSRNGSARGPFDALGNLLRHSRCLLTVLLGNHDVELSLPAVRRHLCENILKSDGRGLELFFDGEACARGELLIEHGNRYDPLNVVDFSRLRQERSHLSRGLTVREGERNENFFLPPYGTHLVVEAFNHLLPDCPFLNLLKPEKEAALPLVLALYPEWLPLLRESFRFFKIEKENRVNRLRHDAQPKNPGQITRTGSLGHYKNFDEFLRDCVGEDAKEFLHQRPDRSGQLAAKTSFHDRLDSIRRRMGEMAATTTRIIDTMRKNGHDWGDAGRLRLGTHALRKLRDESTFSPGQETDLPTLNAAQALAEEGQWKAIVFGHTHLAKDIPLKNGARYINSGTWADVMRLPRSITVGDAKSEAALDEFLKDMAGHKLEPYITRRPTFVEAATDTDGILREFRLSLWDAVAGAPTAFVEEARSA